MKRAKLPPKDTMVQLPWDKWNEIWEAIVNNRLVEQLDQPSLQEALDSARVVKRKGRNH